MIRVWGPERRGQLGVHVIKLTNLLWHSSYSGRCMNIHPEEGVRNRLWSTSGRSVWIQRGFNPQNKHNKMERQLGRYREFNDLRIPQISLSAIYKSVDLNLTWMLHKPALSFGLYSLEVAFIWWTTWSRKIIWLNVEVSFIGHSDLTRFSLQMAHQLQKRDKERLNMTFTTYNMYFCVPSSTLRWDTYFSLWI